MTKDQINDVKIGPRELPDTPGGDGIFDYSVLGLPAELKTRIRKDGNRPSEWTFYVPAEQYQSSKFGSKGEALEGLKDWLRDRFDSKGWLERGDQVESTE